MNSNRIVDIHSAVTRAAIEYLEAAGGDEDQARLNILQDAYDEQCSLCRLIGTWVAEAIADREWVPEGSDVER